MYSYTYYHCNLLVFHTQYGIGVEICPVKRRWAVQPLDWRRWYSKINSYVGVGSYTKDDDFPCNGCYFLVYVIRRP